MKLFHNNSKLFIKGREPNKRLIKRQASTKKNDQNLLAAAAEELKRHGLNKKWTK